MENQYGLRDETVTESKFPYLTKTVTNFYHVGNQTIAKTTSQEYTSYDQYGNILDYVDRADEGAADDVFASIRYDQSNEAEYIVNRPVSIEVKDGSNTIFRKRTASYERGTGNLKDLTMLVQGGTNATWTFDYQTNGNLKTIAYPAGDPNHNTKSGGYKITYSYDPAVDIYVTSITDSFNYVSTAEYDYGLGRPVKTRDINQNWQANAYDEFGRLAFVYGPYDTDSSGAPARDAALTFTYTQANVDENALIATPASAVTRNKAESRLGSQPDTLDTVTFVDGLKRIIQTKKEADINGVHSMTVSGSVEYDTLGRVIQQGQPGYTVGVSYSYVQSLPMKNPTKFSYDTLDRTIRVETPDSTAPGGYAVTTTDYGFGTPPQGGSTMFKTVVKDPIGYLAGSGGKGAKVSYRDVHDNILAVVEYNSSSPITTTYTYDLLNQITAVTDAKKNATTVTYDLLGRRLTINNPDTGLTTYTYDANGNVTTKETANLRTGAKKIGYNYEYNRLVKIDYPDSVDVEYTYGASNEAGEANGNLAGRIKTVTDESGTEQRWYGKLGETVKELRQVNAYNNPVARTLYETDYVFDSFGRMLQMTYPDGEVLYYGYDNGGLLKEAYGIKRQNKYPYIKSLFYDEYGQRTAITYGNNVATTYSYDSTTRRLSNLRSIEPTKGRTIQDISYQYDLVGNILGTNNKAPVPQGGELGGPTEQVFSYSTFRVRSCGLTFSAPSAIVTACLALSA